ncbi:MAG: YggS family pyridoxal phosphate-dependent enzyme [Gammaproteobacteria bacterium]
MTDTSNNLRNIKNQIHEFEKRYHREPDSVLLLAASKTQSVEKIQQAICVGQTHFGENYLQEALEKITALATHHLTWHFIGPIQSNKTKKIAEHFSWVQTVADEKIAQRLNDQRPEHLPPLNICLQVNVSGEKTKSGIHPEQLLPLAKFCSSLPRLRLRGLMTLPEPKPSLEEQRVQLQKLHLLFNELNAGGFKLDTLSMGMSDDLEAAIAEGSTLVRIGTALFGVRI